MQATVRLRISPEAASLVDNQDELFKPLGHPHQMIEILKILISWNDAQLGQSSDPLLLRLLCSLRALGAAAGFWTVTDLLRSLGGPWLVTVPPVLLCLTCAFLFLIGLGPSQPRTRARGAASLMIAGGLFAQHKLLLAGAVTPLVPFPFHLTAGALLFVAALSHGAFCFTAAKPFRRTA